MGNSPVTGEFPAQRPLTRSFDVFFDLRLNKRLSKQWWGWWFETSSRPLWRHCNVLIKGVTGFYRFAIKRPWELSHKHYMLAVIRNVAICCETEIHSLTRFSHMFRTTTVSDMWAFTRVGITTEALACVKLTRDATNSISKPSIFFKNQHGAYTYSIYHNTVRWRYNAAYRLCVVILNLIHVLPLLLQFPI